ncbi:MAG: ATP-dependent DNA helicase RecG [Candidatus Dadabacteria bacterium]|nr:ATP-dependent DNA helicase RecG [Candidatus Dadabacteria bacterium]MYC40276.1 ATP-dependent DNA helicase RecG [Candidatus Dadabacteria bacterium]
MRGELEKNLLSLEKPLKFASKDNFSNLDRMAGLGVTVRNSCTKVLTSGPPAEIKTQITALRDSFSDFERLGRREKRKKISSALRIVHKAISFSEEKAHENVLPEKRTRAQVPEKKPHPGADAFSPSVTRLRGVGSRVGRLLAKKSIHTVYDLLFYSPRKYDDRRKIVSISEATPEEFCTVRGTVASVGDIRNRKRRFFQVVIYDGTGKLRLTWFNYNSSYLRGVFRKGMSFIIHGKVSVAPGGRALQIIHPLAQDIEIIESEKDIGNPLQFGRIVPVYPLTEGLRQKKLREAVRNALDIHAQDFKGLIPKDIQEKNDLMDLPEALEQVHFPPGDVLPVDLDDPGSVADSRAHRTVIFFEFFVLQLGLFSKKRKVDESRGISFNSSDALPEKLFRSLPFALTRAQEKVVSEIKADMVSPRPMNRLLQGDVGSGKTLVALASMLRAVESGYQAALMVPTEILAEQHFRNMRQMTQNIGVTVVLLKSALSKVDKSRVHEEIKTGQADIVVGTHALISESVDFKALGFVVIDEQHRFGVVQRAELVRKATVPDVLVMTATPIPRTLAITVYGDLEVSIIDELPPSRKKVETFVLRDTQKNRTWFYDQVKKKLEQGRQAYFVYPFIEESENQDFKRVRHVTKMVEELREEFSEFRVSLLHGRMKSEERDMVMGDFLAKRCDILVSTTVIEVGVDVPNATEIVIENAERFGLSQLHQMRGRVGRGGHESTCYVVYSFASGEDSGERLKIMGKTSDGFRISEFDLANRGPGEFMGTKQSGVPSFNFANLIRDSALLGESRNSARKLMGKVDNYKEYEKLFTHVAEKWGEMLELDTSS